jgi:FkbM family methyltransferase
MTTRLALLRWQKLFYCLTQPWCWRPLRHGVAPAINQRNVLRSCDHDLLLDVGAHQGQFSLIALHTKPSVPIVAYEPQSGAADTFRKVIAEAGHVTLHQLALGDSESHAEINISRRTDSSSLLPTSAELPKLFKDTEHYSKERVSVARLDSFPEHWQEARRAFLKIDVQGLELQVLRGAKEALKHCAYVYVECSHVELYQGQALFDEVNAFLEKNGFRTTKRLNEDIIDGRLIQADYLFERTSET